MASLPTYGGLKACCFIFRLCFLVLLCATVLCTGLTFIKYRYTADSGPILSFYLASIYQCAAAAASAAAIFDSKSVK